jgi:hypothetical protein
MFRSFCTILLFLILAAPTAKPYSVLAHEAIVDSNWDQIQRLLKKRFPDATADDLLKSRGYAYGGCIVQDMGYYPFGNRLFSDLLHYVRAGDFIQTMIKDAKDVNEYAFALGALAHFAADVNGHKMATNRAVAILYPKLRARYGNEVTYEDYPTGHLKTEFSFDVLQVSQGLYAPDAFHSFIGFEVAKPLLERAFPDTYGLELKDVFKSLDLAIGTYRRTVASLVPEMTKVALATREKQLETAVPNFNRRTFAYRVTRRDYIKEWGRNYYKPNLRERILAFIIRIVPKVGPFRALSFKPLTPEIDKLFLASFKAAVDSDRALLTELDAGKLTLPNVNLDTGDPVKFGSYDLADKAYSKLAQKIAGKTPADVPAKIREEVLAYFNTTSKPPPYAERDPKEWRKTLESVEKLKASSQ